MARTVRAGHSAMRERRAERNEAHAEERDILAETKQSIMKLKKVAAGDVMQAQVPPSTHPYPWMLTFRSGVR